MLLKHINNTTVAMEILKQFYVPEKELYKLKVRWYTISSKRPPICMNIVQRIEIKKIDMPNWKPYYV